MKLKADLHLHVDADPKDNVKHTAEQLIDRAAQKGFEVLAITCHDYIFYNKKIVDYAKSKNILLIPGGEKTLYGKHILLYNITNADLQKIKSFQDIRDLKKQKPSVVVIAPHPYFFLGSCLGDFLEKNIDLFDAIEYVHYYHRFINPNKKAVSIAKKYSKPLVGNSDTHLLFQFGTTFSYIHADKNINSILDAIRNKQVTLSTKPLSVIKFIHVSAWVFLSILKKLLKSIV